MAKVKTVFPLPDIERIRNAYPRKVQKASAIKAIDKALLRIGAKDDPSKVEWLLGIVKLYASTPKGKSGQLCPYPATWFNEERYEDDQSEWQIDPHEKSKPNTDPAQKQYEVYKALGQKFLAEVDQDNANLDRQWKQQLDVIRTIPGSRLSTVLEQARTKMLSKPKEVPHNWDQLPTWRMVVVRVWKEMQAKGQGRDTE